MNAPVRPLPHVERIDLHLDGTAHEVIIMKKDSFTGDIYYIASSDLDVIDKNRIIKILSRHDARNLPLWELMAQETLGNGQNALEFFHQLVKIRTVNGKIYNVGSGKTGILLSNNLDANEKRGPGRPPSK